MYKNTLRQSPGQALSFARVFEKGTTKINYVYAKLQKKLDILAYGKVF